MVTRPPLAFTLLGQRGRRQTIPGTPAPGTAFTPLGWAHPVASAVAWSGVTATPTTLAGYGIIDAQPLDADLTAIAALATSSFGRSLLTQADAAATRTTIGAGTSSFSGAFSALSGVPTTLAGYGITDAYTKTATDALVAAKASSATTLAGYGITDALARLLYADGTAPAGNTVASTDAETAFASTYTVPANTLAVGDILEVEMAGVYSTALLAPTLTGKLKLGSTVVLNTGALTAVAGVANAGWTMRARLFVTAVGAGGTVEAQGFAQFATAATTGLSVNIVNTAAVSVAFNADQAVTATVQWSASSASNSITARQVSVLRHH